MSVVNYSKKIAKVDMAGFLTNRLEEICHYGSD